MAKRGLASVHLPAEAGDSERVRITIGGERFADVHADSGHQPVVWPIVGPSGHEMTRSYPLGPRRTAENTDHPHHQSLWFSHGGVNGHDFWNVSPTAPSADRPEIVPAAPLKSGLRGGEALVESASLWQAGGRTLLRDRRRMAFGVLPQVGGPRYIDFTIWLTAADEAATFADTKEGSFGVRVTGPLKVDAGFGGEIVNSNGQRGDAAWGQPADWVDYHGPLTAPDAEPSAWGGIAVLAHPEGFRSPCRWHVRGYGLFAANPFGEKEFPPVEGDRAPSPQGALTLAPGESITLRYRVMFYGGKRSAAEVQRWYDSFSSTALTETSGPRASDRPRVVGSR